MSGLKNMITRIIRKESGQEVVVRVNAKVKDYRGCQPCKQKMLDQMKKGNDDGIKTSGV